ncbi:conserved hypothetical protein [Cellulomonas flavigena DSM 20109]|uniref:HIT domain-containing protein n=1 Tax=Cellulomonas flavigena (strain ATCC 482 / DSM 20109 / BCRC 11376 / JCM 18109 / NBRC 3775 / NCIMB 8073 / NRS 134) TaxID=446466 RepID=D5UI85_CELFN|nr:hypothetical protein [Cellulomonas flavigena]ADG75430.1 conserved hypothetical protein [Cellulomonas flavigena DSM 20109]
MTRHQDAPRGALDVPALVARARAAAGPDGRAAVGSIADWETFPFERDGLRLRPLDDPTVPEPAREDEDAATCSRCAAPDDRYVWTDATWRLSARGPVSLPTLILGPRAHVDLGDLDDELAGELGRMVVRVERALAAVPGVGRVHVHRWGDGNGHLHLFFFARPDGMTQLRGLVMPLWAHHLPAIPDDEWDAIVASVVASLDASAPSV